MNLYVQRVHTPPDPRHTSHSLGRTIYPHPPYYNSFYCCYEYEGQYSYSSQMALHSGSNHHYSRYHPWSIGFPSLHALNKEKSLATGALSSFLFLRCSERTRSDLGVLVVLLFPGSDLAQAQESYRLTIPACVVP